MSKASVIYRGRASRADTDFAHLPPDGRVLGYMVSQEHSGVALWRERWGALSEFVRFYVDKAEGIENAVRLTDALRGA